MIELTAEQRQAIQQRAIPLRLRDPETNTSYVLLTEDVYDKMRRLLNGFSQSAGWDDPELDAYEQYRRKT